MSELKIILVTGSAAMSLMLILTAPKDEIGVLSLEQFVVFTLLTIVGGILGIIILSLADNVDSDRIRGTLVVIAFGIALGSQLVAQMAVLALRG